MERTRARLKVLSVLNARAMAPYLTPLVDERGAKPARAERRSKSAKRRPALRVLGRREILLEPVRRQAVRDLGFDIAFEHVDGDEEIRQAVTQARKFRRLPSVAYGRSDVDGLVDPADRDCAHRAIGRRSRRSPRFPHDGVTICDDLFRQLYVQDDGRLAARRTGLAAMLPTIHGADSLGYLASLREQLSPGEADSWRWLIDERWRGKVAMLRDPTLGMIEAALAVEGAGILKFGDIANLSIEEIDAIITILKEKKRSGHFRGLWETYEDAAKLMERGGVVVQSIFSPAIIKLRRSGLDVASAIPVEGTRGWRSDLCLSARASGDALEAAYAYLNWWLEGRAGRDPRAPGLLYVGARADAPASVGGRMGLLVRGQARARRSAGPVRRDLRARRRGPRRRLLCRAHVARARLEHDHGRPQLSGAALERVPQRVASFISAAMDAGADRVAGTDAPKLSPQPARSPPRRPRRRRSRRHIARARAAAR